MAHNLSIIPPKTLLQAYASGVFPMAPSADSPRFDWIQPRWRGILPLDGFRMGHNVRRWVRNRPHTVWVNRQFEATMQACGQRHKTWISPLLLRSYVELHRVGHAHSVEVYNADDQLVGGLYGVSLGGAFFGESMFRRAPEMDKVALLYCHALLLRHRYVLWDTQFYTDHLGTFGCIEIPQREYLGLLNEALQVQAQLPTGPVQL